LRSRISQLHKSTLRKRLATRFLINGEIYELI